MKQPLIEIKPLHWQLVSFFTVLFLFCCILQLNNLQDYTAFDIAAIENGQYWRIISGHFAHYDWQHFAMNMAGAALCLVVFAEDIKPIHWPLSTLAISLFSSLAMFYDNFGLNGYVGFSDVLHGWVVLGAIGIMQKQRWLGLTVLAFTLAKLVYEFYYGALSQDNLAIPVATESHIYGAIAGLLYGILIFLPKRKR
jgi:rhomboid family GlyGly-CTERM serine protease